MRECQFFALSKLNAQTNGISLIRPERKTLLWPEKADQFGRSDDDTKKNIRLFLDYSVTIKAIFNLLAFETKPSDALATTSRDAMLTFMSPIAKP